MMTPRLNPAPPRNRFTPALQPVNESGILSRVLNKPLSSFHSNLFPLVFISFAVADFWTCHAKVLQFDTQKSVYETVSTNLTGTVTTNLVWESLQGTCLVTDASDWQHITNAMDKTLFVNTAGAMASPFLFATNTAHDAKIQYVMFALETAPSIRMRETLVCGRRIFRLDGAPANDPENTVAEFERGGWCEVASHKVNGVENAPLEASKATLLEVDMGQPLKLRELAVASDFGRREWLRAWGTNGGGIHEVIFFTSPPSPDALVAVRRYLDFKWKMNLNMPRPNSTQATAAIIEGVHMNNLFSTLLILR
jgi:hypothetical protein